MLCFALAGNRTRVNCLASSYAVHYTTNALVYANFYMQRFMCDVATLLLIMAFSMTLPYVPPGDNFRFQRTLPDGLVARIRRSHRRGPGSIPGQGSD